MTARRWLACTALLLFVLLPLSVDGISATAYGGWPAIGFSAALFFVVGPSHTRAAFAAQTVVVSFGLSQGYDVDLPRALPASLTVTVPALLTAVGLGWGRSQPQRRLDLIDSDRYHLVTALAALACGVLGGLAVLMIQSPEKALLAALMSFLAALSALLVVLPVVIGESSSPAVAGRGELVSQRIVMLLLAGAVLWFESYGVLTFVLFTVLGWAARRSTPREAHGQLFLVCVTAYALALIGRGPLVATPAGVPEALAPAMFYLFAISACYLVVPSTLASEELVTMARHARRAATTVERLFDSAVGTVLIAVDERGLISHFNTGAQRALGYDAAEVIGRRPESLWFAGELDRAVAHFGVCADPVEIALAQAHTGERREWTLGRKDGQPRTLSLSISLVHDSEGRTVGMIASGEDVSERLRGERALAAALERELASLRALQRVDQVKEDLVSTVSHELRTPITSIAGYAELLADQLLGPLTDKQTDALEKIERNTSRLGVLVGDLLTMSRAESGQLELDPRRLDLRTVAREAFVVMRELVSGRSLQIELHLPEEAIAVEGDRVALGRVVENLLSNAQKFTPDGGRVVLTVARTASGEGTLAVMDTGMGIPAPDLPQLFDRFFRSSAAFDLAIQGSGLGLTIAQTIVHQHGGEITVDSDLGVGSTFTVTLPSTRAATDLSSDLSPAVGSAARTA